MDEDNLVNQEPLEKQKLEQLENELENIEKKTIIPQSTPPQPIPPILPAEPASPSPTPPQPIPPSSPMETTPQGTGKSKVVLWIGIALLALALVAAGAYYLGSRRTAPVLAPVPSPTQTLPPTPDPTAGWKTYTDDVAGVSFRYPEAWEISDVEPAKTARILNLSSDYYRAIEFIFGNNPARLSPRDLANQQLARAHYGEVSSTFQIEPFEAANASGVKITGFPYGILMTVVLNHNEVTLTVSLIEGGEIGGSPAASFPTALEDEKLILQILDTLDFSASP